MDKKRSMDREKFLINSLDFSGAIMLFYTPVFLWKLYEDGNIIFLFIMVILLLIHFPIAMMTNRRKLCFKTVVANTCISYGILTALLFFRRAPVLVVTVSSTAVMITVIYMGMLFAKGRKNKTILLHRVKRKVLKALKAICAVASFILMIIIALGLFNGKYRYEEKEDSYPYKIYLSENLEDLLNKMNEQEEADISLRSVRTVENSYDKLKSFLEWNERSFEERMEALQSLTDVMHDELQLKDDLKVESIFMGWFSEINAYYVNESHNIFINEANIALDSYEDMGLKMLDTVCHECFHAWQWQIVESFPKGEMRNIPGFEKAGQYAKELENYIDGTEDYEAYSSQSLEKDSNEFAVRRSNEIYEELKSIYNREGVQKNEYKL